MTGVDLLLVITDPTEGSNECFVGCFMVSMLHCYMDVLSAFIYNDEETLKRKKTLYSKILYWVTYKCTFRGIVKNHIKSMMQLIFGMKTIRA